MAFGLLCLDSGCGDLGGGASLHSLSAAIKVGRVHRWRAYAVIVAALGIFPRRRAVDQGSFEV